MTSFLTGVRLSDDVEKGAVGGPRFNTTVLQLDSGFEKRNVDWSQTRGEWDVGYGLLRKFNNGDPAFTTFLEDLQAFFYIVNGRAFSFRFKDWSDFEIALRGGVDDGTEQTIGTGDGSTPTFQVFKRYAVGAFAHDRTITKLATGTTKVYIDTILDGSATTDDDRGTVTPTTVPLGGEVVAVRTEFDVHARLDTDGLDVNMEIFNGGSWPSVPVIELRGTGLAAP